MKMKLLTTIDTLFCPFVGTLGNHTCFTTKDNAYKDLTTDSIAITLIEGFKSKTGGLENTYQRRMGGINL